MDVTQCLSDSCNHCAELSHVTRVSQGTLEGSIHAEAVYRVRLCEPFHMSSAPYLFPRLSRKSDHGGTDPSFQSTPCNRCGR